MVQSGRSYRILVHEGAYVRPLAGMRLALTTHELQQLLEGLRSTCPGETFTYETLRPGDQSRSASSY